MKAMNVWNELPVDTRNAGTKSKLRVLLKNSIENPYKKISCADNYYGLPNMT